MITFSSFRYAKKLTGDMFSAARSQPKTCNFPTLNFLGAEDAKGKAIYINEITPEAVLAFEDTYKQGLVARWDEVKPWLDGLSPFEDITLLCWCPYSKPAEALIAKYGMFYCHHSAIASMVAKHRPDIEIVMDFDRRKRMYAPVNQLIEERRVLKISSTLVGEDILLAKSDAVAQILKMSQVSERIYTEEEIGYMKGMSADAVRCIHNIKRSIPESKVDWSLLASG